MKRIPVAAMAALASLSAVADEGMWTFDNPPREAIASKYGVTLDSAWLDRAQRATIRLESGCTGSFISADGLVLTNHHCAEECIAQNSTPENDLVGNGFYAGTRAKELKCGEEAVSVLVGTEDVTAKVAAATAGLSAEAAGEARRAELARLEQACEEASKKSKGGALKCERVSLYQGGQHWIYKYKRYDDVRLVFAPERDIAAFGGDPDNFQFPRWCLDMSVLRAYENGRPARTPNRLRFDWDGANPGDAVFVSGHPGNTDRLLTVAQLETQRTAFMPFWLLRFAELRGRLLQYSKTGEEPRRTTESFLNQVENSIKVRRKQFDALLDPALLTAAAEKEAALRKAVTANPALADTAAIEELAALLAGAKNPIVITEEAGRDPGVVEKLVELAELLGAGVVESRASSYVNFPRTHPLHAGFEPQEFLQEADVIFLLGVIAPWHPASKKLNSGTKVAVLSDNPLRSELPYWGYRVNQILTGEIDSSMKYLLDAVKKKVSKGSSDAARRAETWRGRYEKRKAEWKEDALRRSQQKPIDTRWVTHELAQVIPSDAIVVEETITHRLSIHRYLDMLKPGTFFAGCIGGLGTGTGTALGVKAANPKRPVLCLIGDGAFNYDPGLAALGVCQEHNLPILIVLFNNYGYHSQKSGVPRFFPDGFAVKNQDFIGISINPSPDYAMIARAFDGYGEKVEEPGEVRAALQRGLKAVAAGQVALIDVRLAKAAETNERPDRAN